MTVKVEVWLIQSSQYALFGLLARIPCIIIFFQIPIWSLNLPSEIFLLRLSAAFLEIEVRSITSLVAPVSPTYRSAFVGDGGDVEIS